MTEQSCDLQENIDWGGSLWLETIVDTSAIIDFLLEFKQNFQTVKFGEWSRDWISWDQNWHFSTFGKIDQESEMTQGALGDHYFRLFSKT